MALTECSSCGCRGNEWKVELAQFVPPPSLHTDHNNFSLFKPSPKTHFPSNGTWISSAKPGLLVISSTNSAAKLHVELQGKIYENHLISRLKFTWPQLKCQAKLGTKGGRVVFVICWKESSHKRFERSKFALRFDTAFHASDFMSTIQQILPASKLRQDEEPPRSVVIWDESSASERVAAHEARARENIHALPYEVDTQTQEMHSSIDTGRSPDFEKPGDFVNNVESACPELPPRFTSHLHDYVTKEMHSSIPTVQSPDFEKRRDFVSKVESVCPEPRPRIIPYLRDCYTPAPIETKLQDCNTTAPNETNKVQIQSLHNVQNNSAEPKPSPNDLKARLTACFSDPTFQDFVCQVEKVWNELHTELMKDQE